MTIAFTDGSITTTTSEDTVINLTANEHFASWIFLHNMTSSETFRIKVYVKDQNGGALRTYATVDLTGVQSDPSWFIAPIPTKQYKVTIQKTAGTNRVVTWQSVEVA